MGEENNSVSSLRAIHVDLEKNTVEFGKGLEVSVRLMKYGIIIIGLLSLVIHSFITYFWETLLHINNREILCIEYVTRLLYFVSAVASDINLMSGAIQGNWKLLLSFYWFSMISLVIYTIMFTTYCYRIVVERHQVNIVILIIYAAYTWIVIPFFIVVARKALKASDGTQNKESSFTYRYTVNLKTT